LRQRSDRLRAIPRSEIDAPQRLVRDALLFDTLSNLGDREGLTQVLEGIPTPERTARYAVWKTVAERLQPHDQG
jgi:hypothetical protein